MRVWEHYLSGLSASLRSWKSSAAAFGSAGFFGLGWALSLAVFMEENMRNTFQKLMGRAATSARRNYLSGLSASLKIMEKQRSCMEKQRS